MCGLRRGAHREVVDRDAEAPIALAVERLVEQAHAVTRTHRLDRLRREDAYAVELTATVQRPVEPRKWCIGPRPPPPGMHFANVSAVSRRSSGTGASPWVLCMVPIRSPYSSRRSGGMPTQQSSIPSGRKTSRGTYCSNGRPSTAADDLRQHRHAATEVVPGALPGSHPSSRSIAQIPATISSQYVSGPPALVTPSPPRKPPVWVKR